MTGPGRDDGDLAAVNQGDYGAIGFGVLTEGRDGDADRAPERPNGEIGANAWIPRG